MPISFNNTGGVISVVAASSSGSNIGEETTITFTSALTTSWIDVTGASGNFLDGDGSYVIQVESNAEYYVGFMYWYSGVTSTNIADEIPLDRGSASGSAPRLYVRKLRVSSGNMKLQVAASASISSHEMTFNFVKLT
jgi:hypothetical protein